MREIAKPPKPKILSVADAADALGIDDSQVRRLIRSMQLGQKIAGVWLLNRDDLAQLRARRAVGRPKSGNR